MKQLTLELTSMKPTAGADILNEVPKDIDKAINETQS